MARFMAMGASGERAHVWNNVQGTKYGRIRLGARFAKIPFAHIMQKRAHWLLNDILSTKAILTHGKRTASDAPPVVSKAAKMHYDP